MKHFFPISAVIFAFVFPAMVLARATDPPCEITFKTKNGDVLFPHQKHVDKVEKKCDVCHDKVFAKDSKAPLNFKDKMHKTAEASKSSCATCHVAQGKAFESKGNCVKCHKKK